MSDDDVKAELERLRSENEALKRGSSEGVRMKVSEKGGVSIYGMGRFPGDQRRCRTGGIEFKQMRRCLPRLLVAAEMGESRRETAVSPHIGGTLTLGLLKIS
jgi:hypothetical protein